MKIRNGFVSNSSSSSFVIAYHDGYSIESVEKLKEILDALVKVEQCIRPNITFDDIFTLEFNPEEMYIGGKKDIIKNRMEWEKDLELHDKTDFKKCKGKIIINSADENSVPYWMKTFLEENLGALYWHWG